VDLGAAQALGVGFGIAAAVARNLKIPVASQAASIYVWFFFRGTPLLLQLFFWFFVVPQNAPGDIDLGILVIRHGWFIFSRSRRR